MPFWGQTSLLREFCDRRKEGHTYDFVSWISPLSHDNLCR